MQMQIDSHIDTDKIMYTSINNTQAKERAVETAKGHSPGSRREPSSLLLLRHVCSLGLIIGATAQPILW